MGMHIVLGITGLYCGHARSLSAMASKAWMRERPGMTASNAFPCSHTSPAKAASPLAFRPFWPQIGTGRLAVDEPLANRVRSGRKQP